MYLLPGESDLVLFAGHLESLLSFRSRIPWRCCSISASILLILSSKACTYTERSSTGYISIIVVVDFYFLLPNMLISSQFYLRFCVHAQIDSIVNFCDNHVVVRIIHATCTRASSSDVNWEFSQFVYNCASFAMSCVKRDRIKISFIFPFSQCYLFSHPSLIYLLVQQFPKMVWSRSPPRMFSSVILISMDNVYGNKWEKEICMTN